MNREEDAVEAGIEAASEAVGALPMGQQAWGKKEYMIAEKIRPRRCSESAR